MAFGSVNVPGAGLNATHQSTGVTGTSTTETVFSNSGIALATPDDTCINPTTGNVYKCTTGGAPAAAKWVYTGCIKGPPGATGATGTRGSTWTVGTAVTGTSTTGTIFSGSGITSALVGDMYLNSSTWNVYKCTTAGAASVAKWAYVCNIRGAAGAAGTNATINGVNALTLKAGVGISLTQSGSTATIKADVGKSIAGQTVTIPSETVTAGTGAEIFNDYRDLGFTDSGKLNCGNIASGKYSHAEGSGAFASGEYSHAEGCCTTASGYESHAEGFSTAANSEASHAEGSGTTAKGGHGAHAEGYCTTANGQGAHAEGSYTTANGLYSHAGGWCTYSAYLAQTAIGMYNTYPSNPDSVNKTTKDLFVIGKGSSDGRANVFRVTNTAIYGTGSYNSTGADYAELFEWADGNPDREDRIGRFVTLDGEKIRLAGPDDDFVLGIISGAPSVVGDVHDDQWQGMYLYDIYGRPLWEDVEVPAETIEEPDPKDPENTVTRVIVPAHTEHRQKINPDYDNSQPYIPRTERPEWGCVGLMGKLVVRDDGACQVNGWATVGEGGIATHSAECTNFRVLARMDETHVRVLILGRR